MATFPVSRQKFLDLSLSQFRAGIRPTPPDPEEPALLELKKILGTLVHPLLRGPDGVLDLSRIPSASFEEFKKFLLDQVSVDGIAFNDAVFDSYHKVLAKEKYRPLLEGLYQQARSGSLASTGGGKRRENLLKQFTADIIGVSAERFVNSHLDSQEGRLRLRSILKDPSCYSRDCRSDLIKAIATVGNRQGAAKGHWEGVEEQIDTWNYWNIGVTEGEIQRATYHALKILEEAGWQDEYASDLQKKYQNGPREFQEKFRYYLEKRDEADPISQYQARLADFWLLVADDDYWTEDNEMGAGGNRTYLLKQIEELLEDSKNILSETALARFNQKLTDFLEAPLPGKGSKFFNWLEHKAFGRGLEELFAKMPSRFKAPYEELRQFSQEIAHTLSMGERIPLQVTEVQAKEEGVRQGALHLIQGLEQTKRSLWFSYKQHRALSRAASYVAAWGEGGDIVEIRRADQWMDDLIACAKKAASQPEMERIVDRLQSGLKEAGVLHRALVAAEMDGCEQLIGLGQSVIVMMATIAATQGLGAVSALGNLGRVAGAVKNIQTVAGRSAQMITLAHRASYGLKMGAWISFAENQIAIQSGEVRQGRDSWWKLGKDSLATGLAMGLFTPLAAEMGLSLERNVLKRLLQRYFTHGVRGVGRFSGDTVLEGMEEIVDATLRHKLDGGKGGLTFDQAREITLVAGFGGGTKMGTLAGAFRRPGGVVSTIIETAPVAKFHAFSKRRGSSVDGGALSAVMMVGGFPFFGLGRFKKKGSVEATVGGIQRSTRPVAERLERLAKLQFEIREARSSSQFVRDAARELPRLFRHRSPRIREAAHLAYLETLVKLPPRSEEIQQAAGILGKWISDKQLPASVRYGAMAQYLPLLMRLPPGHSEILFRADKILTDLVRTKTMTDEKRLALPVLEKLAGRLGDDHSQLGKMIGKMRRVSQGLAWDGRSQALLQKLTHRLQWRHRKLVALAKGSQGPSTEVFQEIILKLSDPDPSVRERTLAQIEPLYQEIQWHGLRLRYLIELGVLSHLPSFANWGELREILQCIRDGMNSSDADLVDVGIDSTLHGDEALSGYVEALMPSEAWALKFHLMEEYFKYIPADEVTTTEIPGILFKLNDHLNRRSDFEYVSPIEEPPDFAEAHARQIVETLLDDPLQMNSQQVETLIDLAQRGSSTAESYLRTVLGPGREGVAMPSLRSPKLPDLSAEPLERDTLYPNPIAPLLEDLMHKEAAVREAARAKILPALASLETPGDRLHFVIELGKRSNGAKLPQWKELEATLQSIRDKMHPKDILLADLGIRAALEGEDRIDEGLEKMKQAERAGLAAHIREKYLNQRASEEDLALAPKIIQWLWARLEHKTPSSTPGPDSVFGLVPFLGIDQLLGFSESLNLNPGTLGLIVTFLGLAGLGMAKSRGRSLKATDLEIAEALERHGGDRAKAARDLSISKNTIQIRIPKAEPGSPLAKFKVHLTDAQIAQVLQRHDDLIEALRELPIGRGALRERLRNAPEDSPLHPFKKKRYVASWKSRKSFKFRRKVSDEQLARTLDQHGGNQLRASSELPISPQAISARILRAQDDSPLAKFKRKGRGHRLIPLALGFGLGAGELFQTSAAHAAVPGLLEAVSHPAHAAFGTWGWAGLAAGVLMAAATSSQNKAKTLLKFLGGQLRLSPEQLSEQFPQIPKGLEFLNSLAEEKGWGHSEQEQFLMANYIWLSRPDLVEKVLPILRDPDLGFKSLQWIFSFQERGRGSIDLDAEMEARTLAYGALRGRNLDEVGKVDFLTRWTLARMERIKPARFTYPLNREVFSALAAMDQMMKKRMERKGTSPEPEKLRRSYAAFLASYGRYQRALEVFAPIEQKETIFPEQTKPLLKVQMAEQYFSNQDFPELQSNGRYPNDDFAWQKGLSGALAEIPDWDTEETTVPLNRVIPYHYLGHARRHESFIDTVNQIRKGWLFDLMVKGWRPGTPVEPEVLKVLMVSVETPRHLPLISGESGQGYALVVNGHHRLASLISLVADGLFPRDTLAKVPLERIPAIKPSLLVRRVFESSQFLPKFSWADVLQFHDFSVAQIPRLGLTADYRRFR